MNAERSNAMADKSSSDTSNRGFASMAEAKQRAIASKGGKASGGNFANNPRRAAEAGRKGGQHSHGGRSRGEWLTLPLRWLINRTFA
jgi:uncharacterized protein